MAEAKGYGRGRGKCNPRERLYKGNKRKREVLLSYEGVIMKRGHTRCTKEER